MIKIPLFSLLCLLAFSRLCDQPQKTFYMSYPALAHRDALHKLFQEMNPLLSSYNSSYTDSQLSGNFKILNLKPNVYYNEHYQVENYISTYRINVTMGEVYVATWFNFSILYSDSSKYGQIRARAHLDPSYFTKSLSLVAGYLQWQPDVVPPFSLTQAFYIEYSEPKLTEAELSIFSKMLNNQAGTQKIRNDIIIQVNALYPPMLKTFLNHEDLISTNKFIYKYRDFNMTFQMLAKDFGLTNGQTKGLQAFFIFGLSSSTQNCTKLPTEFDQDQFGGFQQVISFSVVRAMVKQGLSKGLFDVQVDQKWQTPGFQLFMGDLGMSVPNANFMPAGDRFSVNCSYSSSRSDELKISRYDEHDIYLSVPTNCTIIYQSKPIIAFVMDVTMVVRLVGLETSLRAQVTSTGVFGIKYTSLDSNYQVTKILLAQNSITQILKGLVGQGLFGTGFPLLYRRYPVIRIFDDRIIIYDPSEA